LLLRFSLTRKNFTNLGHLISVQGVWEFYFKVDEKVSVLVWSFVEWHTKTFNAHHLIWLHNSTFIVLDSDLATVQVGDGHVNSGKRFKEGNLFIYH
jgi:hypothetical protein